MKTIRNFLFRGKGKSRKSAKNQKFEASSTVEPVEDNKKKQQKDPRRHTIEIENPFSRTATSKSLPEPPSEKAEQNTQSEVQKPRTAIKKPMNSPPTIPQISAKPAKESKQIHGMPKITSDDAAESQIINRAYDSIPVLEQIVLPRGGCSVDTKAVGRVQFGIPPETIKDSMKLGIPVPQVYIVPVERFCREMGPALGVNLAEFEFPAYFNYFVYNKKCTLVVDSIDAEENIRRVFSETLLGPAQFRKTESEGGIINEDEDFAPDYPRDARPNFYEELKHFRIMPDGHELELETLLVFCHFEAHQDSSLSVGTPPQLLGGDSNLRVSREQQHFDPDAEESLPTDESEVEKREKELSPWTFTQTVETGDVSRVYPFSATPEQIREGKVPRVEIFKMPGGTEYVVHDIDENNIIIGKARFSGHVKVKDSMRVEDFGGISITDEIELDVKKTPLYRIPLSKGNKMKSFHPPSFGVTILGNSHGFDKKGSVSGYVLWINGRGVMIDPPPYSSATLEREGIRPRTIVGIILTHCHADHDAGAFQKVLTGSPVVVITTPTIYKSFIRKYAALSALSPALLRHSHRFKPAVIGEPLRFQGATFHFLYSLHTIPCVGFRVEWRGRSMVFSADHFHKPDAMEMLEKKGVLTKARADALRNLPLQDTDVLLHESGAPPIHTPLAELMKLPDIVKKRLYVVHTSALPEDCGLKVAPTGTGGTIRLDDSRSGHQKKSSMVQASEYDREWRSPSEYQLITSGSSNSDAKGTHGSPVILNTTPPGSIFNTLASPPPLRGANYGKPCQVSHFGSEGISVPKVALRPASSTDAWFILNLLSAVPFLSSLSYSSTMEVLEMARVDAYSLHDIVVPAKRRNKVLCVVWEGTCAEQPTSLNSRAGAKSLSAISANISEGAVYEGPIWYAGDWTGPISLQPEEDLSGESKSSLHNDIVAMSEEGVKVITIDFPGLHSILKSGSVLYRRFLDRIADQELAKSEVVPDTDAPATEVHLKNARKHLNVIQLLSFNSALRKLTAVQKRHFESLAVGPVRFGPGEKLWIAGTPVDKAFIIVSGAVSFVQRRRNAGSAVATHSKAVELGDMTVGESMNHDAEIVRKEYGRKAEHGDDHSSLSSVDNEEIKLLTSKFAMDSLSSDYVLHDFEALKGYLSREGSVASGLSVDSVSHGEGDSVGSDGVEAVKGTINRRRSSKARQANKVLGRLYSRRAFTGGLLFSRGHFLGDVSKMVAGSLLSSDVVSEAGDSGPQYGFGEKSDKAAVADNLPTITEASGADIDSRFMHSSTLTAGPEGCVVLVFPRATLIPFLDEYPGLLLSLLGTQVVV